MMDNFFDDNATPSFGKALLDILRITAAHKENLQSLVLLVLYTGCCIHSYEYDLLPDIRTTLSQKHLFRMELAICPVDRRTGWSGMVIPNH